MSGKWLTNEAARERVSRLLDEAGLPLELQTTAICQRFAESMDKSNDSPEVRTSKIIYSPSDTAETYREVDQLVQFYDELEVGDITGVQLIGNIPIEAKYRREIEYFAFPTDEEAAHTGFPVSGDMAGSQYFRELQSAYEALESYQCASVAMLQITDGETPRNVYTENLHYNGAGALYDFVLADAEGFSPDRSLSEAEEQWLIEIGSFSQFQKYVEENRYAWWSVLRNYIPGLPIEECRAFNSFRYGGGRVYHTIQLHMPILCVNGPIHFVEWTPSAGISGYSTVDACLLQIRKQKWPGPLRYSLLNRTPEVPAVLTNTQGLSSCLELAHRWYERISEILRNSPVELIERWPLEAAFYSKAIDYFAVKRGDILTPYRSDLDIEHEL